MKINVLPAIRNIICAFGSKPNDCYPKIKSISDSGLLTIYFPIPLISVLNDTLFLNASQKLNISFNS